MAQLVENWHHGGHGDTDPATLDVAIVGGYVLGVSDTAGALRYTWEHHPEQIQEQFDQAACLDNAMAGKTGRDLIRSVMFLLERYDYPNASAAAAILAKACNL